MFLIQSCVFVVMCYKSSGPSFLGAVKQPCVSLGGFQTRLKIRTCVIMVDGVVASIRDGRGLCQVFKNCMTSHVVCIALMEFEADVTFSENDVFFQYARVLVLCSTGDSNSLY